MIKIVFLISLLLFSSNISFGQVDNSGNFKFDYNERVVSWIKVFEPENEIDFLSLHKYFSDNNILKINSIEENSFKGEFIKRPIDIQKYGYSRGRTPMVLLDVEQIFNVLIEYKDGRYRAILTDIGYIDDGVMSDLLLRGLVGNTSTTAKGNIVSYNGEFSFTKKNEVRKNLSSVFELLDKFYIDMLSIKSQKSIDEDW
jgi:hypothetical protein